ncbi:hypothetical protein BD413DRAFT_110280 [Trametes elegans]|nr:hypothetical protein BD413DRAFT_110280 [Trametes elegans]
MHSNLQKISCKYDHSTVSFATGIVCRNYHYYCVNCHPNGAHCRLVQGDQPWLEPSHRDQKAYRFTQPSAESQPRLHTSRRAVRRLDLFYYGPWITPVLRL